MLRLASGGARMEAESTRMVTEKVAASAEAQTVATVAAMKAVFDSGTNYPGFGHAMADELAQSAYKLLLCYDLHGAC